MDTNAETLSNLIYDNVQIIYDESSHSDLTEICKQALKLNSSKWYALYFRKGDVGTLLTNYPSEWMSYYHEIGYNRIDYARDIGVNYFLPLIWGNSTFDSLTQLQKKLFLEASDFQIQEGLSLPLISGKVFYGILSISRNSHVYSLTDRNVDYGFLSQGLTLLIQEDNLTRRKIICQQLKTYLQSSIEHNISQNRQITQAKSYLSLASQVVKEHPGLLESNYFIQKTIEIFDGKK